MDTDTELLTTELAKKDFSPNHRIAILIPCFNEEKTIASVVDDFRAALPEARIYVFDNNSTDNTASEARRAGAIVRFEARQGTTIFRAVGSAQPVRHDQLVLYLAQPARGRKRQSACRRNERHLPVWRPAPA